MDGQSYTIPSPEVERRALQSLEERFTVLREVRPEHTVTYHDTFDWRLYMTGSVLWSTSEDGETLLVWAGVDGQVRHRLRTAVPVAFAADLPAGVWRETLAPILEMRRLLPIVEVRRQGLELRLLDDLEKTVVRLVCERNAARGPATAGWQPLLLTLRTHPVRGYDREHRELTSFLASQPELALSEGNELTAALAAIGRTPGDYSSKPVLYLNPAQRADVAVVAILRSLFHNVLINEDGVRRDLDSEFLHDFRVAGRRTRSALSQIKGVFAPAAIEPLRRELSWLGQITGPTRDLDVYLLKMDGYKAALPEAVRQDLAPLGDFLQVHQRREQQRMAAALDTPRYRQLVRSWSEFLDRPLPAPDAPAGAGRPIGEVAGERIWRAWRRVWKKGRAIDHDTPVQALHRLRIDCKKLRYLLEFFRSLYPAAEVERLIRGLKRLQDNLGDFNDFVVQQETLRRFADQMQQEGSASVATLMALGRLIAILERGQEEERQRFAERFADFSQRDKRRSFRRLFAPSREDATPAAPG